LRHNPVIIAALTTVLFAGTLGVLIAVAGFGVIRIVEEMAEALGILPLRWGENNVSTLLAASGLVSLPVVAGFGVWFYRKALAAERLLHRAPT
jgi:hypothetical protein